MSLHERTATFRSPASNRQAGGDRSDEQGRQPIARSSSGAMGGGSEGRELHERFPTARSAAGSSDPVKSHSQANHTLGMLCSGCLVLQSCCMRIKGEGLQASALMPDAMRAG